MKKAKTIQVPIFGLHCAGCAARASEVLRTQAGVHSAEVNLASASVEIVYDEGRITLEAMRLAIEKAGYELVIDEVDDDEIEARHRAEYRTLVRHTMQALLLGGVIMLLSMLYMGNVSVGYIVAFATIYVVVKPGGAFYHRAYKQITGGGLGMDTLVAISTGVAYVYSLFNLLFPQVLISFGVEPHLYFEASAMIIAFVLLGKMLEGRAKSRTRSAIKRLVSLQPKTVVRLDERGRESIVPIESVGVGELILVRPGEGVALDGMVEEGCASLDESMLTGESMPVEKRVGDLVYAGTISQNGVLTLRTTSRRRDTVLSRIIRRVKQAQGSRAPIQRLVDRISSRFVVSILVVSVLTFLLWLLLDTSSGAFTHALVASISVLIIACPCALGLATPTAIMVGIGRAASEGILIKDAESLEMSTNIDTIVLDKTGTITRGKPQLVAEEWLVARSSDLEHILYSTVARSAHPLSSTIRSSLAERVGGLDAVQFEYWQYEAGLGIVAQSEGRTFVVGSELLLSTHQVALDEHTKRLAGQWQRLGTTVVYFAQGGELLALMGVADEPKPSSERAIARLKSMGIRIYMLTGDNEVVAQRIAQDVGIEEVCAGVLPEAKADFVAQLRAEGAQVAMVGDGINDSAALATADVSIAMGHGSDIAIETAMVTIVSSDLERLPSLLHLSEQTMRTIRQNLFWAFVYNIVAIPVAAGALYPLFGFLMTPMLASLAMTFSSVSVVANSLRLSKKYLSVVKQK